VIGTTSADTIGGDTAANRLMGGAGTDTLDGRDGADYLDGGVGDDTLRGGAGNDFFFDMQGAYTFDGGLGNDRFYGSQGATMLGGDGDDRFFVFDQQANGGAGNDLLQFTLSTGVLTGGAGADVFMANAMGAGSDRITDFNPLQGDVVDLSLWDANEAQAGNQRWSFIGTAVFSDVGQVRYEVQGDRTMVLVNADGRGAPDIELELAGRLALTERSFGLGFAAGDGADVITGTRLAERIDGLGGDDSITGGGGADLLYGGDGRNLIRGGDGDDWIVGGGTGSQLHGDAGDDSIQGWDGNDRLEGGAGNDDLYGSNGADTLVGGPGSDVFSFLGADDGGVGAGRRDVILDFAPGDLINLANDLETARWFRDAPTHDFVGTAALTGPGQVRYEIQVDRTIVQVSDGFDATPSLEIELAGKHALTEADFIL
jgi:Ca2+-binding RTX toxin-like protein